jgi:hypothetical protein
MNAIKTTVRPIFRIVDQFWASKPGNHEHDWEDGFAASPEHGLATVTDGASAGIYCRDWAAILAARFVRDCPQNDWPLWWESCVCEWQMQIQGRCQSRPFQLRKVAEVGAAAALIGLQLAPFTDGRRRARWRAWSIGDCSLFLIRNNRLGMSFPFRRVEEFPYRPELLGTNGQELPKIVTQSGCYRPGDVFLLTSDAIARWLIGENERNPNCWAEFAHFTAECWRERCQQAEERAELGLDDYTILTLQVPANGEQTR